MAGNDNKQILPPGSAAGNRRRSSARRLKFPFAMIRSAHRPWYSGKLTLFFLVTLKNLQDIAEGERTWDGSPVAEMICDS